MKTLVSTALANIKGRISCRYCKQTFSSDRNNLRPCC
jgi:hypothetical protein